MGAGKHQAGVATGIEGGTSSFGHVVREERGMENDVMFWEMSGKRRRGRSRTKWLDNVNKIKIPSINSLRWDARDRHKIGEVQPRLSPGVGHDSTAHDAKVQFVWL